MRILLDTVAVLRAMGTVPAQPPAWRDLLADLRNERWISSVSLAEIAVKAAIGKLEWHDWPLTQASDKLVATDLPFLPEHAERMRHLPLYHRDPFDRMIIAQALVEDLTVMTTDRHFAAYGVRLVPSAD